MTPSIIDNPKFKILFRTLVALPATLVLVFCSFYAVVFTIGLFKDFSYDIAPLIASYYFGLLGFIGAWIRLIKTKQTIGEGLRTWLQCLLMSGLLSSIILGGMFILNGWYVFLLLPIGLFAIGAVFLHAT